MRIVRAAGGTFEEDEDSPFGRNAEVFDVADYDDDGVLDFASVKLRGVPGGVWSLVEDEPTYQLGSSENVTGVYWIDADADGDLDLLLLGVYPMLLVNEEGVLEEGPQVPTEGGQWYEGMWAVADDGGDGVPDALGPGGVVLPLPDVAAEPVSVVSEEDSELARDIREWADYDGDGDLDILATRNTVGSHAAYVFRNDGGEHTRAVELQQPYTIGDADWIDLDGDGDLDLAVSPDNGTAVRLYENAEGEFLLCDEIDVEDLYSPSP